MKVGYLHIIPRDHGVNRYGHFLKSEAVRHDQVETFEYEIGVNGDWWKNISEVTEAARYLTKADVVHFQFSRWTWGRGFNPFYLLIFVVLCRRPFVVTLHDIYIEHPEKKLISCLSNFDIKGAAKNIKLRFNRNNLVLVSLVRLASLLFVCTQQEEDRLASLVGSKLRGKIKKIPHFVEERDVCISTFQAKSDIGLTNLVIVTVLGWIHRRKGHDIALESLAMLPKNCVMVFAGGFNDRSSQFVEELKKRADALDVKDRLHITGYLSETELEKYTLATDIALCPFRQISASGSLSTWISVKHPRILVSDLPQTREYDSISPNSVTFLDSICAKEISEKTIKLLNHPAHVQKQAVQHLQEKLSIAHIFNEHLDCYKHLIH